MWQILWLLGLIIFWICSYNAEANTVNDPGTYLYRSTCFTTNSGQTEDSRYLIDNILKMGVCTQSEQDLARGTSQIYWCRQDGNEITVWATLYSRTDCAISHEVEDVFTIPSPWSTELSGKCEGATGQQNIWACENNPSFLSSSDWIGTVMYQNTTTLVPEECPVLAIPSAYAFSKGCVRLGGGGGAKYVETTTSGLTKLSYTEYVQDDCSGSAITELAVTEEISSDCKRLNLIPSRPFGSLAKFGYGSMSIPMNTSSFALNDVGVGPNADPPVDVIAILLTLGGGICVCCCCICVLFYFMKRLVTQAVNEDENDKEQMWQRRNKAKNTVGGDDGDTESESDGDDIKFTENPLLAKQKAYENRSKSTHRRHSRKKEESIVMFDNPLAGDNNL